MKADNKDIFWPGWETIRLIGNGSFGAVYEIQRDIFGDIEKAALKVISIPQNTGDIDEMYSDGYDEESITSTFKSHLKSIVAEYSMMRKMNGCTNIVNCDDVRYVQHDDGIGWDIFIKMELLTPLTKALTAQVSEETIIKIAKDICTALELCKKHEIVHRDIKPQNIFVSPNGDYKLGDFGIAKTVEKTMGGTKIGTYKYMAPEVYNNKPYGSAADIYSLGLVLYWLLNERRMPFLPLPPTKLSAGMDEKARNRRLSGEQFPEPKNGSPELKAIVMKACAYNVEERYASASEMLADLNQIGPERILNTNTAPAVSAYSAAPVNQTRSEDEDRTVAVFGKAASKNVVIPDAQLEEGTVGLFFKPAIEPALTNSAADVDSFAEMKDITNVQIEAESGDVSAIDEEFERKENTGRVAEPEKCSTMIPDDKDSSVDQSTNQNSRKSPIAFIMLCVGMIAVLLAVFYFSIHFWTPVTCTEPSTCKICGKIGEVATGHTWKPATCTEPSTCNTCGQTGEAATGHAWKDATCTQSKHCPECGKTSGAALGHDWALSADCSGMECNRCDATSATQVLESADFKVDQGWNSNAGFGLNNNGRAVYWQIGMELLNIDAFQVDSVVCSWNDSIIPMNGKTSVDDIYHDYGWEAASSGLTLWRSYPNYEKRQFVSISLPDDKTIEGSQRVTIIGKKDGAIYLRTISFTLTYDGDYQTGTGWSISNISMVDTEAAEELEETLPDGKMLIDESWDTGGIKVVSLMSGNMDTRSLRIQITDNRPDQQYEDYGTLWTITLDFGDNQEFVDVGMSWVWPYRIELRSQADFWAATECGYDNYEPFILDFEERVYDGIGFANNNQLFHNSWHIEKQGNVYSTIITFPEWFDVASYDLSRVCVDLNQPDFYTELSEKGSVSHSVFYSFDLKSYDFGSNVRSE